MHAQDYYFLIDSDCRLVLQNWLSIESILFSIFCLQIQLDFTALRIRATQNQRLAFIYIRLRLNTAERLTSELEKVRELR